MERVKLIVRPRTKRVRVLSKFEKRILADQLKRLRRQLRHDEPIPASRAFTNFVRSLAQSKG